MQKIIIKKITECAKELTRYDILSQVKRNFEVLKSKSQVERIRWHLLEFGRISNEQAHSLYGIRHLPRRIMDLEIILIQEKSDYWIEHIKKTGVNRFGDTTPFVDYTLRNSKENKESESND